MKIVNCQTLDSTKKKTKKIGYSFVTLDDCMELFNDYFNKKVLS